MNRATVKNSLYLFGKILGVAGLLFVFYKLSQEYTFARFAQEFRETLPLIPLLILLNILSLLAGIFAWHKMLLNYAAKPFGFILSYYYFTRTEISKYLPGNVFHFVGRQVFASKLGISQKEMAKTSMLLSYMLLVSTLVAATLLAAGAIHTIPLWLVILGAVASLVALATTYFLYPSFPFTQKFRMALLLVLSLVIQGSMLAILVSYQTGWLTFSLLAAVISIYIISWLIGFVTPGASGGLGIREGVFISAMTYLHIDISSDIVIFSILLVRLINIIVDIILYFTTYLLENKIKGLEV